jgi:hypothetical protein
VVVHERESCIATISTCRIIEEPFGFLDPCCAFFNARLNRARSCVCRLPLTWATVFEPATFLSRTGRSNNVEASEMGF